MKIYIHLSGQNFDGGLSFRLYTKNYNKINLNNNHGIQFDSLGKSYIFAWVDYKKDIELPSNIVKDFMFSFMHGSNELSIQINKYEKLSKKNIIKHIESGNFEYKILTTEDYNNFLKRYKVNKINFNIKNNIINNAQLIYDNSDIITSSNINKIIKTFGLKPYHSLRGEIGLEYIYNHSIMIHILEEDCNVKKKKIEFIF